MSQENNGMLSDKIIKRIDKALDNYVLNKMLEVDKESVIERLDKCDEDILHKIVHYATDEKDTILDEYRECKENEDFLKVQEKDFNRIFLFDVYTCLIGNLTMEELEKRYCSNSKKKIKDLK